MFFFCFTNNQFFQYFDLGVCSMHKGFKLRKLLITEKDYHVKINPHKFLLKKYIIRSPTAPNSPLPPLSSPTAHTLPSTNTTTALWNLVFFQISKFHKYPLFVGVPLISFKQQFSINTLFIIVITMEDQINSSMFIYLRYFKHVSLFRTIKCIRKKKRIGEMEIK